MSKLSERRTGSFPVKSRTHSQRTVAAEHRIGNIVPETQEVNFELDACYMLLFSQTMRNSPGEKSTVNIFKQNDYTRSAEISRASVCGVLTWSPL